MQLAIRSGFIAAALYYIHRYLSGDGAWLPHHVAMNVVVSGAGILTAAFAVFQFVIAAGVLTVLFLRRELR